MKSLGITEKSIQPSTVSALVYIFIPMIVISGIYSKILYIAISSVRNKWVDLELLFWMTKTWYSTNLPTKYWLVDNPSRDLNIKFWLVVYFLWYSRHVFCDSFLIPFFNHHNMRVQPVSRKLNVISQCFLIAQTYFYLSLCTCLSFSVCFSENTGAT